MSFGPWITEERLTNPEYLIDWLEHKRLRWKDDPPEVAYHGPLCLLTSVTLELDFSRNYRDYPLDHCLGQPFWLHVIPREREWHAGKYPPCSTDSYCQANFDDVNILMDWAIRLKCALESKGIKVHWYIRWQALIEFGEPSDKGVPYDFIRHHVTDPDVEKN
jgi:hypothetical protein